MVGNIKSGKEKIKGDGRGRTEEVAHGRAGRES